MPQQPEDVNMDLPDFDDVLEESQQILRQCFKQYQIDEVFLSFNGGKDCTALLDITINVLRDLYQQDNTVDELKVVYIRTNGPFAEIEAFVEEIEGHYGVKLKVMEGSLKETLERLIEQDGSIKACLMGTRRTDPYSSNLEHLQNTDTSWPQLMRVSPLLDWSYHQIWSYILRRRVPYCCLYDKGYTSIGSTQNTWPNPSLAYKDSCGCLSYYPAWKLTNAALERAGRGAPPPPPSNGHSFTDLAGNDRKCNGRHPTNDQIVLSNGHSGKCNGETNGDIQ